MSEKRLCPPLSGTCDCDEVCRAWLGVLMDPPPVGQTFTVWCPRGRTCALPLPIKQGLGEGECYCTADAWCHHHAPI